MSEQKEKEFRIIPLDADQSLFFNWFLAYSYMLAPEDPKLQSNIFHYRLLQHVLENPARTRNFFNKKKNEGYVRAFRKALLSKTVKAEITKRKKRVKRIGEVVRFLNAMKLLEIDDPSINKAYYLSKKGFQKREEERGGGRKNQMTFSSKTLKKGMKDFNAVLHLCAAYSAINPDGKKVKGPKTKKIRLFLSKSEQFREFLLSFEYTRQASEKLNKGEYHELLIGPLYDIPEDFEFEEVATESETSKFVNKMEKLLPGFSYDWEKKLNK
jgi:hypothetical protein